MINENAGLGGWEQIEKEAIPNDFLFQQFSLKLQLHHNEFISLIEYDDGWDVRTQLKMRSQEDWWRTSHNKEAIPNDFLFQQFSTTLNYKLIHF